MSEHEEDEVEGRGVGGWITRLLGLGMLAATVAAIVGSLDDLKRYLRMKNM